MFDSYLYGTIILYVVLCWCETWSVNFNPLNAKLNPAYHFLALLGAHHILHVSRIKVKVRHYVVVNK